MKFAPLILILIALFSALNMLTHYFPTVFHTWYPIQDHWITKIGIFIIFGLGIFAIIRIIRQNEFIPQNERFAWGFILIMFSFLGVWFYIYHFHIKKRESIPIKDVE